MAAVAQAAITRVMEEWNFKDWATAEAFYKAQQHQLQSRKDRKKKNLLQVWVAWTDLLAGLLCRKLESLFYSNSVLVLHQETQGGLV